MIMVGVIELFLLIWIMTDVYKISLRKENQNTIYFLLYLKAGLLGVTIAMQTIINYFLAH